MKLLATGELTRLAPDLRKKVLERGGPEPGIARDVTAIRDAVLARGDDALRELTERFDGAKLGSLEVPRAEAEAALARLPRDVADALRAAHANIARFHQALLPGPVEIEVVPGLRAGRRPIPLARVGAYVPGGRATYPSTVLMTATPAKVAGVREVVVATPPGPDGKVPDATLAACAIAGVDRVYRVGGAQAIFALAFGTATIPRVDKIVGPGNAWVAAAKAAVAAHVAIDAPAGPSEVLVLADETADPALVAAEMLAQAEHDPRAACVALVANPAEVEKAMEAQLANAPRRDVIEASLARAGAVLSSSREDALAFADAYAPEHLVLLTRAPRDDLARLSSYGSAFLGPWSSVAFGDYASGPNHVLPTLGLARGYSGLSVDDFLRRPTHQEATAAAARLLSPLAETLATLEGLPAHAAAARLRRERA
ncbi:MAG: histidinol dehydrogenase [Thermoplasmata archaeon]|jgi:histidinol dehydrogenase|nr:histidinol dehydrogenase [Thermoplasmata archaeon]